MHGVAAWVARGRSLGYMGLQSGLHGVGCRGGAHVGWQLGLLEHGLDLVVACSPEREQHELVVVDEAVEDLIGLGLRFGIGVGGSGRKPQRQ